MLGHGAALRHAPIRRERADRPRLAARRASRRGELVVLPTDTVYGIGADAFSPTAVGALLAAKGRGRDMPVPVLVGSSAHPRRARHRLVRRGPGPGRGVLARRR